MKLVWFSTATILLASPTLALRTPESYERPSSALFEDNWFAQTESQQLGSSNPIAQAKESMKELKAMVDQDDAKSMGYAEFGVFKKLRLLFRKKSKHSDDVYKKLKALMKNGWTGEDKSSDTKGSSSSDKDDKKKDDKKKDDKKKKDKKKK